ncbi:MAG: glycosyltransferase [Blastocatellia bacterium]|nr:glycosyltransferase [Blastocatellia bacterium]
MFRKVLILSASAGAGHLRAAQAIERAFLETNAAQVVKHIDTLDYTNRIFRHFYAKAYLDLVNDAPEVLGWLYDALDKPWQNERRRLALDKLNTRPFVKMLNEEKPDIAICTHFLPSEIISWLTAKERLHCPQAVVVTDFDVHAMWLCHHYQHYFVALEETQVHLEKLGIPAGKITVSGIPIDPVFTQQHDKTTMRLKHGLAPDTTTILISAGGFGVGNIERIVRPLLELKHPAQIVAICGKSEELRSQMDELAAKIPVNHQVQLKVVGFTKVMDEWMSAADILLGKPGGLTTSEALTKGLVFCIVNPIPGQEERNSDHLLEEGVAIRCNNLPALAYKIDRLLDQPEKFTQMKQAALALSKPFAARTIVEKMCKLNLS